MFILTKNKIENNELQNVEKNLISKRTINIKDSLVLNNPKHLTLIKDFDINNYNHLYEVQDYIIRENEKLFSYIKTKNFDHILKILCNTHDDNMFARDVLSQIISSNNLDINHIKEIESMIQELINTIYGESELSPTAIINKLKDELYRKENLSDIETLKLDILKKRTTRWTLLKINKNLSVLINLLNNKFDFYSLKSTLKNPRYFVYLCDREYSTIFDKNDEQKYISSNDLFSNYRFRDLKEFKDNSSINYKRLKYLYVASNNYILQKISYKDFLNDDESVIALTNMFRAFKEYNIDSEAFNKDFLERVITENHDELKMTIYENHLSLVPEDMKDLFKPDEDEIHGSDSVDILSFVSNMYDITD